MALNFLCGPHQALRPGTLALKDVGETARARRKAKKRSLRAANEHFIRFTPRSAAVLKHVQPEGCELI